MTNARFEAWVLAAATLSGCAFFGKSEPLTPRFYTPEQAPADSMLKAATTSNEGLALRLGRVLASAHLREQVAYQASERELGFYEQRRWTERPETYLGRALSRALFQQAGITHVVSGPAPTLDVELLDFTEVRAPRRLARVRVRALLSDGRTALLEQTFAAEEAVKGAEDDFEPVVGALAKALERVVDDVAQATTTALRTLTPASLVATPQAQTPGLAQQESE